MPTSLQAVSSSLWLHLKERTHAYASRPFRTRRAICSRCAVMT
jgi:hypothetical protein